MKTDKEQITSLLLSTQIDNIDILIKWLEDNNYFTMPASTKYHYAFEGGLAKHCLSVYRTFNGLVKSLKLDVKDRTVILVSLLHDICKCNAYIRDKNEWKWNNNHEKGHAKLSLQILNKLNIPLINIEGIMIKYHMGMYGTHEFSKFEAEYSLKELVDAYNKFPLAKLFYFADDISSQFLEK